jgi:tetratricopeptide (TPR) repeat protein
MYLIGLLQLKKELYKESEKSLKKAIKLDKKNYKVRFTLGIVYLMLNKIKKAKLQYKLIKRKEIIRGSVLKIAIDFIEGKKAKFKNKRFEKIKYDYLKELVNENN